MLARTHARWTRSLRVAIAAATFVLGSTLTVEGATAASVPTFPTLTQLESYLQAAVAAPQAPSFTTSVPTLSTIPWPWYLPNHQQCFLNGAVPANLLATCAFGDLKAKHTIFIYGDSQAAMWIPTFVQLGTEKHYRIVYVARSSCSPAFAFDPSAASSCRSFLAHAVAAATKLRPSFIFPVGLEGSPATNPSHSPVITQWSDVVTSLKPTGAKVILLSNIPHFAHGSWPTCPLVHPGQFTNCFVSPVDNASAFLRQAALATNTTFIDVLPLFCTSTLCPEWALNGSVAHPILQDDYHMNAAYALWITHGLESLLMPSLAPNAPIPSPLYPQTPLTLSQLSSSSNSHSITFTVSGGLGFGSTSLAVQSGSCTVSWHTVSGPQGTTCTVVAQKAQLGALAAATSAPMTITIP